MNSAQKNGKSPLRSSTLKTKNEIKIRAQKAKFIPKSDILLIFVTLKNILATMAAIDSKKGVKAIIIAPLNLILCIFHSGFGSCFAIDLISV